LDDPQVWTSVVGRLCDLRDPEAYDLFGQLFEAGMVNELSDGQMAWAAPQIHCLSTTCHLNGTAGHEPTQQAHLRHCRHPGEGPCNFRVIQTFVADNASPWATTVEPPPGGDQGSGNQAAKEVCIPALYHVGLVLLCFAPCASDSVLCESRDIDHRSAG
jgi:hypothetical protein